jgi:hypothetical protein
LGSRWAAELVKEHEPAALTGEIQAATIADFRATLSTPMRRRPNVSVIG